MPTYGYVSRSVLLSLLVFSTMSILTDSGSVKWQVAENTVSNRQADSIKYPVWLTLVSQALKSLPCETCSSSSHCHSMRRSQNAIHVSCSAPWSKSPLCFKERSLVSFGSAKIYCTNSRFNAQNSAVISVDGWRRWCYTGVHSRVHFFTELHLFSEYKNAFLMNVKNH